jgi:hypothetical protein
VTVAHPWGDIETTLEEWIRRGPGLRPLVQIVAAKRRSTGEPISMDQIPLEYHNSRESRRLQRLGRLPTPWGLLPLNGPHWTEPSPAPRRQHPAPHRRKPAGDRPQAERPVSGMLGRSARIIRSHKSNETCRAGARTLPAVPARAVLLRWGRERSWTRMEAFAAMGYGREQRIWNRFARC